MYVNPAKAQFRALVDGPRDTGPIFMINLVKFRALADYPEGHVQAGKGLSGRQAYNLYGREAAPILARVGGKQIWAGKPALTVTGPETERWDIAFIAQYPNTQAFLDMLADETYRQAVLHRTAAVEDSRLIRCDEARPGEGSPRNSVIQRLGSGG